MIFDRRGGRRCCRWIYVNFFPSLIFHCFAGSKMHKQNRKCEIYSVRTYEECSKTLAWLLSRTRLLLLLGVCLRSTNMIAIGLVVVVIAVPQNWVTTMLRINPMQTEDPLITIRAYAFTYPRVSGVVDTFGNRKILLRLPHTICRFYHSGAFGYLHKTKRNQNPTAPHFCCRLHQQFPEVNCKFWQCKMHFLLAFGRYSFSFN